MSDFFGISLSEPNLHLITRMMDMFNGRMVKNNENKLIHTITEKVNYE